MLTLRQFLTERNQPDVVCVNIPLFIRLLEHAREDVKRDEALHKMTENILTLHSKGKKVLTMNEYNYIVRK